MKILYHHRTQGRGAEGVHIASIVRALEQSGHQVVVLSPPGIDPLATAGSAPVDKSEIKTSGITSWWKFISRHVPNFAFELLEMLYNFPAAWRLYRNLSGGDFDLVYERYAFYLIAGAGVSRRLNIPFVLEANEVSGIPDRARKQVFSRLCSRFERYILGNSTQILTVSSYLKNLVLEQGIVEDRVIVVPNAIEPGKFATRPDTAALVERYRLQDKLVIGFAGWFDDWDRLDLLVEVFAELKKRHAGLVLLLIGDGAVLEQVRTSVRSHALEESVIMTGAVSRDEITRYLSLLDIAVITHSNEFGSPVVMFEFMGLKIPVVAPRLMPIQDVLKDGDNALLFDPLDMAQMTKCVEALIEDGARREALAESSYKLLLERHTWTSNARIIVEQAR